MTSQGHSPVTPHPISLYGWFGVVLLAALYLLVGQVGHDPWRGDDSVYFAPVYSMLKGEGWLLPRIAGEPYLVYPPLFYWLGSVMSVLLGWVLDLDDAVRLTTSLCVGSALYFFSDAARRLYGEAARAPAALLMLGSVGLVVHAHETQPQVALLAAQGLTFSGIARLSTHGWRAAVMTGLGAAAASLSVGVEGALLTLPTLVLLFVFCPDCQNAARRMQVLGAIALGLLLPGLWLLNLAGQDDPALWTAFWWEQRGLSPDYSGENIGYFFRTSSWFLWPLWPIALWTLWSQRKDILSMPWLMPLIVALSAILILMGLDHPGPAAYLPLLAPFVLLGAAGVPGLRRGAANAFDWFGIMTFTVIGVTACLAWSAMVTAWPPGLARQLVKLSPGFKLSFTWWPILLAGTILLLWLLAMWFMPKSRVRGAANWALGMVMMWCLTVVLLLPWFEYDKSYRAIAGALALELSKHPHTCVARYGLSTSLRATLDYFAGVRTQPLKNGESSCELILLSEERRQLPEALKDWVPVWSLRRSGKKQGEAFRLYQRPTSVASSSR